ncbi:MAG: esterase-like activity of phytase family protein [Pseudomonadota bacterium]
MDIGERQIARFSPRPLPDARLAFRGGLVLRGPRRFGALSGMLVEGTRLLAVSDTGTWFAADLVLEDRRLVGLNDTRLIERLDTDGSTIRTKRRGDAEALAKGDGGILVLIERARALLAYAADGLDVDWSATPQALPLSREERRAGRRGIEAMTFLPNGDLLLIAEGRDGDAKQTPAFILGGRRLAIARRDGFAITGADALPGGDVILVERRYGGGFDVAMRVRRIGADAFATAAPADGPILLEAGFSAEIDNMEAVAAQVIDGEIVLTLLSDDNDSFLQRTLLLRFVLTDPLPRPNPQRASAEPPG